MAIPRNLANFANRINSTGDTPAQGSNTQIQFNSSGVNAGSSNLTFNGTGITSGFFAPTSSSGPSNGIFLSSANTLGFVSNSQSAGMFFNNYQIGSTGSYVNQLSVGQGIDTSNYQNLNLYSYASSRTHCTSSNSPVYVYSFNGNTPWKAAQVTYSTTNYNTSSPDNQYCMVGSATMAYGQGGWVPTQFPTGSFQVFPQIGIFAASEGQVGNQTGTSFYGTAYPVYSNSTAYYARTIGQAPTSGSGYCYRAEIGSHAFGNTMVGYHSRIISGQGGGYGGVTGWYHIDETGNGSAQYAARFEKGGNAVGSITLTTSATTYNTSSDPRQKNVTGPITSDEAKNFVMALQPKKGTWKSDGSVFQGFLSTEYALVDPSAVSGVAGATEIVGNIISAEGNIINSNVTEPPADKLPPGGEWVQTEVKDIYQSLEYGSAAWCANMTAHAQYLQSTIDALLARVAALESK